MDRRQGIETSPVRSRSRRAAREEHCMTQSTTFPQLGVSAVVADALAARGITAPFPIQVLVMEDALAGRDVLAKSKTGSGKTLAFALPIVERLTPGAGQRPQALVLVPTRELASQVVREFDDVACAKNMKVAAAYGGVSIREQANAIRTADILAATPEGAVGQLASRYTNDAVLHEIVGAKATVDEAGHRFIPVTDHGKVDALIELLLAEPGLALVFVRTKRGADRLAMKLKQKGLSAAAMHGDLSQQQRERTLAKFTSGKLSTLIA